MAAPTGRQGILTSTFDGRYIFIPYNDDTSKLSEANRTLINEKYGSVFYDPEKKAQVEQVLDKELDEHCFWEWLHADKPTEIHFRDKV